MGYTPVRELSELYPSPCRHLSAVRTEYADWNWYTENGYIRYSLGDKRLEYEHRMVARLAYGDIPAGYHVHHIDHDITNNAANNLAVVSGSEHARLHSFRLKCQMLCPVCGQTFDVNPSHVGRRVHCSDACRRIAQYASEHPSREQLADLLVSIGNWTKLGQMFGVSDNAVRKWAKQYGLDLSVCDGRRK